MTFVKVNVGVNVEVTEEVVEGLGVGAGKYIVVLGNNEVTTIQLDCMIFSLVVLYWMAKSSNVSPIRVVYASHPGGGGQPVGGTGVGVKVGVLVGSSVSVADPAGTVGRSRVGCGVAVARRAVIFTAFVSINANEKLPKTIPAESIRATKPPSSSLRRFISAIFPLPGWFG
jgi:hypothetical protein